MDFSKGRKQIILRHDIDTSLVMAHEMAKINADYKIKATFALQIGSSLYNPFTTANIEIIDGIHRMGHSIILHPRALAGQTIDEVRQSITSELQAARCFFAYVQPVFVWHNLSINTRFRDLEIPNMVNFCSAQFGQKMHYISDSVLRHKPEDFIAVLGKHEFIQMLFHPTAWMSGRDSIVPMLACVLSNIIRECNHEFAQHPAWKSRFPDGMPDELLAKVKELLSG